jgi:EpsI family protein
MSVHLRSWAPAALLGAGLLLVARVDDQRQMPLRQPLDSVVPKELLGFGARDIEISDEERAVAGMNSYVMRSYGGPGTPAFTLYVGYYESQAQGRTIHSPRNCLPGAGWESLAFGRAVVATAAGIVTLNRYMIQREDQRAIVLYWYQGRGRVESSEYVVKWDLLRDAALKGRSEEALVRVVVPVVQSEEDALRVAEEVAKAVIPAVDQALPGREG